MELLNEPTKLLSEKTYLSRDILRQVSGLEVAELMKYTPVMICADSNFIFSVPETFSWSWSSNDTVPLAIFTIIVNIRRKPVQRPVGNRCRRRHCTQLHLTKLTLRLKAGNYREESLKLNSGTEWEERKKCPQVNTDTSEIGLKLNTTFFETEMRCEVYAQKQNMSRLANLNFSKFSLSKIYLIFSYIL